MEVKKILKDIKSILLDFIGNVKFHIIKEKNFNILYKEIKAYILN